MPRLISKLLCALAFSALLAGPSFAEDQTFNKGPVFADFGPHAKIDTDFKIPKAVKFAITFDTAKPGEVGGINRTLESVARFTNMHVAAGVQQDNIKLAVIVHGKAVFDMSQDSAYGRQHDGAKNANVSAIKSLTEAGVRIVICGQSAAHYGVKNEDLLPGTEMALSAMTAHALLQQSGYTLNPF